MYVWRRLSLMALCSHSQEVTGMVHACYLEEYSDIWIVKKVDHIP